MHEDVIAAPDASTLPHDGDRGRRRTLWWLLAAASIPWVAAAILMAAP